MTRLTAEHVEFQRVLRTKLRASLPADIQFRVQNDLFLRREDFVRWNKILYNLGCFAKTWPKEYGGPGWDLVQQYIFEQENALAGAPWIIPYGIGMVGPVLIRFGTEQQRSAYLPGILRSDTWWCQGYSEPNAGSDLASLQCRAVRSGDHYVLNGTKMWTTMGHYADMMHALVRTSNQGRKQQGITFLLIDMKTPGITVRPIVSIDAMHHTNQVFFDDVRVPIANRVGAEGDGWAIAKFLLSHERTAATESGWKLRWLKHIERGIDRLAGDNYPPPMLVAYRLRLGELTTEVLTLAELEKALIFRWHEGGAPSAHEASALKIRSTEIEQALAALGMEIRGAYRSAFDPVVVAADHLFDTASPSHVASASTYQYLRARAASIYAGSNEIQRNVIASAVLREDGPTFDY